MKVFFTCPTGTLVDKFETYDKWVKLIESKNHEVTGKWIYDAYKNLDKGIKGDIDSYYKEKIEALSESDVLIAESSEKSLGVVHQITLALNKNMPVLVLVGKDHELNTNGGQPIQAIMSPWLTQKIYSTDAEAQKLISNFLNSNKNGRLVRFNLVLTKKQDDFLKEMSKAKHDTRTGLIRSYIEEKMAENSSEKED